ncbi:MAG: beta-aspartyl-peptidase [Gammaproteobacteria bacterium]|nr:beta-aspartyl-peptidase [Gammaproteobacteria bacterium]
MKTLSLIKNARVLAPGKLGIRHLIIAGEKIAWMGDTVPSLPAGTPVIDLEGQTVVPGLVDGHVHLTGGGGESGFATRVPPLGLSRYTAAGVTTAIGVLGTDDCTRSTRDLVAQALGLREQGLSAWCHTGGYHLPPVTITGSVRDDVVFIEPVIGVGEVAISDHRSSQPTSDELMRLASEVHVAGLITGKAGIVHLHLGDGERGLGLVRDILARSELPARVFNPTHCNRRSALFDEALALAGQGCTIDLTAFPVADDDDALWADDALARFLNEGAPAGNITVSSDGGGCLPVFNPQGEMLSMDIGQPGALLDMLRRALSRGVDLADALPSVTSNPARLLRLSNKGRIAEGADADLLVVDDAVNLTDVMARGRWHLRESQPLVRGVFEETE